MSAGGEISPASLAEIAKKQLRPGFAEGFSRGERDVLLRSNVVTFEFRRNDPAKPSAKAAWRSRMSLYGKPDETVWAGYPDEYGEIVEENFPIFYESWVF
jgi:hypothetical protein